MCGSYRDICSPRIFVSYDMMKEKNIYPDPVPETAARKETFGDMVSDGIVGKRCLTVQRLFGLTAASFLPDSEGLCPLFDAGLRFSPQNPRYANCYAHVRETEARLWSFLHDGKRVESLVLWGRDAVLETQLVALNRGFVQKKKPDCDSAVLISEGMSVSEKDYDTLWKHVQKGNAVLFLDKTPTDERFYKAFFSGQTDETGILPDTYIKKEISGGGCILLIKSREHTCRVLKAALDDAVKGNVWVEDTYPVRASVRYLHKKTSGKNVYLFYNNDEECHASQYVRLPYSTSIVAVDPKSGGTWQPEQQRYESETWFKLWLAPEESLLYVEEGAEFPLFLAEDYPKKTNWENLAGEARICGYGALPAYCMEKGRRAVLRSHCTPQSYQFAVTVCQGEGSICFSFGHTALSVSRRELCYSMENQERRIPFVFDTPAKRLYITVTEKEFSVRIDGQICFCEKSPEGRKISIQNNGSFTISALYVIKIK